MKLTELRKVVPHMSEESIITLYTLYETSQKGYDDPEVDHDRLGAKIGVLEAELARRDNGGADHVDRKAEFRVMRELRRVQFA